VLLLDGEIFLVKDLVAIAILDEQPKRLRPAVQPSFPFKVLLDFKLNLQLHSRQRLEVGVEFESRELLDELVENFPNVRDFHELTYLLTLRQDPQGTST